MNSSLDDGFSCVSEKICDVTQERLLTFSGQDVDVRVYMLCLLYVYSCLIINRPPLQHITAQTFKARLMLQECNLSTIKV